MANLDKRQQQQKNRQPNRLSHASLVYECTNAGSGFHWITIIKDSEYAKESSNKNLHI